MLLTLFLIITGINIAYWLFVFSRLVFYKKKNTKEVTIYPKVTVIVCAKNEAANLEKNLPILLSQNYPEFEMLVVNDRSTDESSKILLDFQKKYENLNVLSLKDFDRKQQGKKFALEKGLQAAKHDIVLLTDADCFPSSPFWIKKMVATLGEKDIVLGYGPYTIEPTLLSKFSRYEELYGAIQYFSFAQIGLPYMGVGRNLMYRKSLFLRSEGFKSHQHIASGDDDLFINNVANYKNTVINLEKETFMFSPSKTTWRSFYRQKRRHLSASTHYKRLHIILLGLLSWSFTMMYLLFLILLLYQISTLFVIFIILSRLVLLLVMNSVIYKRLGVLDLLVWMPLLEVMYWSYLFIMSPTLFFSNKNQWT